MELLKEVANISGRSGLFRIIKPGRSGVIVEGFEAPRKREMISANARVSVLSDISMYTTDYNVSTPLGDIFKAIREKHGEQVDIDAKNASADELFKFLGTVMPDYDVERIHASDVKKLIQWYNLLSAQFPALWEAPTESAAEAE